MTGPATFALAATVAAALCAALSVAETGPLLSGQATPIDGDTVIVAGTHIRLAAIDAPELRQTCWDKNGLPWSCGAAAKAAITRMLAEAGWSVSCTATGTDRYGRTIALCRTPDGRDLGARMIATGHALAYRRYGGERYNDEETAARTERLGLWSGTFEPPWEWRAQQHKKR